MTVFVALFIFIFNAIASFAYTMLSKQSKTTLNHELSVLSTREPWLPAISKKLKAFLDHLFTYSSFK